MLCLTLKKTIDNLEATVCTVPGTNGREEDQFIVISSVLEDFSGNKGAVRHHFPPLLPSINTGPLVGGIAQTLAT